MSKTLARSLEKETTTLELAQDSSRPPSTGHEKECCEQTMAQFQVVHPYQSMRKKVPSKSLPESPAIPSTDLKESSEQTQGPVSSHPTIRGLERKTTDKTLPKSPASQHPPTLRWNAGRKARPSDESSPLPESLESNNKPDLAQVCSHPATRTLRGMRRANHGLESRRS